VVARWIFKYTTTTAMAMLVANSHESSLFVPNDKSRVHNRLLRIELAARANRKRRPKDLQKAKAKTGEFLRGLACWL